MLIADGFQLPLIPFVEVVGRLGPGAPWQIGSIGLKIGFELACDLQIGNERSVYPGNKAEDEEQCSDDNHR